MSYFIVAAIVVLLFIIVAYGCSRGVVRKKSSLRPMDNPIIVAHRGASGNGAPENSLSAIEGALQLGVDMIEVDIRLTKDGELVVCHDAKIERTTNGRGAVAEMTLEQIREYRLKDNNDNVTEELLPTLGEVLELVDGRCKLLIDVKRTSDAEQISKALINEVALYQAAQWVVVQSFDDEVLEHLHRLGHPFPLEKLFKFKLPLLPIAYDGTLVGYGYSKYDYISSFNFYYGLLSASLVDEIHAKGKKVKVWTLDIPSKASMLPVDGIITNHPELWKRD